MSDEGNGENKRRRRRPRRRPRGKGSRAEGGENSGDSRGEASETQSAGGNGSARSGRGRGNRSQNRGRGRGRNQRNTNGRNRQRRGRVAENWWARRWVEVLEKFAVGRRLGRGRSYARQGNIVDIEIGKGFVTAQVQGSRDAPYLVRMHFSMLSSTDWKKITRALIAQSEIAIELGMGQIPSSIEGVFEEQNLSLFPNASGDLKAACSCPDNANPCKHVAAVYYLLGEEFDRDPFLIFQLRGMERAELMTALGSAAIPKPPAPPLPPEYGGEDPAESEDGELLAAPPPIPEVIEPPPEREIPDEPLPDDPDIFWGGATRPKEEDIEVRIPRTPGAVAARLGGFPFWRGQSNCEAAMARTYRNASITGLDVYLGADETGDADDA
ncbi:MAG: SWIM zinc finger family protein [Myxococcota bacterium]